jgi:hypothetical protein
MLSAMTTTTDFLKKNIFFGLTNCNDGFDNPNIWYFSENDFATVLERVQELGIGITGIEPWKNGQLFDARVYEAVTDDPTDPGWYLQAFEALRQMEGDLLYAATFYFPLHAEEEED